MNTALRCLLACLTAVCWPAHTQAQQVEQTTLSAYAAFADLEKVIATWSGMCAQYGPKVVSRIADARDRWRVDQAAYQVRFRGRLLEVMPYLLDDVYKTPEQLEPSMTAFVVAFGAGNVDTRNGCEYDLPHLIHGPEASFSFRNYFENWNAEQASQDGAHS